MKIITLRPFRGDEGFVNARTHMSVDERRAKQLVQKGLAMYAPGALQEAEVEVRNKMLEPSRPGQGEPTRAPGVEGDGEGAAEGAGAGEEAVIEQADPPAEVPRRGSRTGKGKPRSSSRQGRQRRA